MSIRLLQSIFIAGVLSPVDGSTLSLSAALEADLVNQGKAVWVAAPELTASELAHASAHARMRPPNGVPIILAQSAIPMILPSSGTMGANGSLTGLTALPYSAFPQPCFMYFPAGKVYSGSPAGMYYASITATTTATVYNNMYASGRPQDAIPAVPTAVVDAGPGAYTQTTGTDITVTSYLLPGGLLGLNGMIRQSINAQVNNNANTKILRAYYGASIYGFQSLVSTVSVGVSFAARNRGVANSQFRLASAGVGASGFAWGGAGSTGAISDNISVNSAVDQQVSTTCNLATATDYICVDAGCIEILPG